VRQIGVHVSLRAPEIHCPQIVAVMMHSSVVRQIRSVSARHVRHIADHHPRRDSRGDSRDSNDSRRGGSRSRHHH